VPYTQARDAYHPDKHQKLPTILRHSSLSLQVY
jgi:hypothetical protein